MCRIREVIPGKEIEEGELCPDCAKKETAKKIAKGAGSVLKGTGKVLGVVIKGIAKAADDALKM